MKGLTRGLCIAVILALSFAVFPACAPLTRLPEAKPGLYVNRADWFTVNYPEHWKSQQPRGFEIFRVASTNKWRIPFLTIGIGDRKKDAVLVEEGKYYLETMKKANPQASRFKILSEKSVKLQGGTPALALTYEWFYNQKKRLRSAVVIAYREKFLTPLSGSKFTKKKEKVITVSATTVPGGEMTLEEILAMCLSLRCF